MDLSAKAKVLYARKSVFLSYARLVLRDEHAGSDRAHAEIRPRAAARFFNSGRLDDGSRPLCVRLLRARFRTPRLHVLDDSLCLPAPISVLSNRYHASRIFRPKTANFRKSATFAVASGSPARNALAAIMQSIRDPRRRPDSLNRRALTTESSVGWTWRGARHEPAFPIEPPPGSPG